MTISSVRSNFVNFSPKKNMPSNGSKPIKVLTRTKPSCSDDRLPIGFSRLDFQPILSNFVIHSPPPPPTLLPVTRSWGVLGRLGLAVTVVSDSTLPRAADMTGITKKGNQDSIGITENTLGFRRDYEK